MRKLTIGRTAVKNLASCNGLALLPKCTLAGVWLRAAGFEIGDRITVEVENGTITIKKEEL